MLDTIIARADYQCLQDLGITIRPSPDHRSTYYKWNTNTDKNKVLQFNPTAKHFETYGYMPNVTLSYTKSKYDNSFIMQYFKLQCSVPKILYGHSYFMSDEADLELFCIELAKKLKIIGINLTSEQIKKLSLSSATMCYNIILPERYGRPVGFLKKLSLLDVGKHVRNVMNTEYNESAEGYCERRYSQNMGYKMYDKTSEVINQAKTPQELVLRDKLLEKGVPTNILRLEKCYQTKSSLKSLINPFYHLQPKSDVRVEQMFNNELCKQGLQDMRDKLGKTLNLISADIADKHPFMTIEFLMREAKKLGLRGHEIAFFTSYAMSVSQMGVKNTNNLYDEVFGRQGQKDRSKYLSIINKKLNKADLRSYGLVALFDVIKEQLTAFKIYKNEGQAQEIYEVVQALHKPKEVLPIKQPPTSTKTNGVKPQEEMTLFANMDGQS